MWRLTGTSGSSGLWVPAEEGRMDALPLCGEATRTYFLFTAFFFPYSSGDSPFCVLINSGLANAQKKVELFSQNGK